LLSETVVKVRVMTEWNERQTQTQTFPPYATDPEPLTGTPGHGDPWVPPSQPSPSPGRGPRRGVRTYVAVAALAGLLGGAAGAGLVEATDGGSGSDPAAATSLAAGAPQGTGGSGSGSAASQAVERVAADVLPSVVSIQVQTPSGGGEGSGVVISPDGLILTNNHVVEGEQAIRVTFNNGRSTSAQVVGTDPVTDLAVVRARGVSGLKQATLGDSSQLQPGEQVVAIGSPLGLEGTVTSGIVSALNRPVRTGSADVSQAATSTVIDAIQTDAAINPGNSGGPLVNLQGQVVGINSAIASLGSSAGGQSGSIGLGFSIPIDQARYIAKQLIDNGSAVHAQLGVGVSVQDAPSGGAVIASVNPGTAAAQAGLQRGDVITKVDSRSVDGGDALIAAVRSHQPGDTVRLTYHRGGSAHTVSVRLHSDG
jgi:putative serine protease PepD